MVHVNLIPREVQVARTRRLRSKRWMASSALSLCALLAVGGYDWINRAEAKDLVRQKDNLRLKLIQTRDELGILTQSSEQLGLQIERAQALHAKRGWSAMLAMVHKHMTENMWLTTVATHPTRPTDGARRATRKKPLAAGTEAEAAPQQVAIDAPRNLRIIGFANRPDDPSSLVTGLKDERIFGNVKLIQTERKKIFGKHRFRFEILCEW